MSVAGEISESRASLHLAAAPQLNCNRVGPRLRNRVKDMSVADEIPAEESLRVQFSELNIRSRWYSSQLWQLPLAYLTLTGAGAVSIDTRDARELAIAFIGFAALGILLSVHLIGMRDGEARAIRALRDVEDSLKLKPTVQYRPGTYVVPLQAAVVLATVLWALIGLHNLFAARGITVGFFGHGTGANMLATAGLISDAVGASILATGLIVSPSEAVKLASSYSSGDTEGENLKLPPVADRLRQSRRAKFGLAFLLGGFLAQMMSYWL